MTALERRFIQYHKDITRTFLAAGSTPFRVSKAVWRLHVEMGTWLAVNAPDDARQLLDAADQVSEA